MTQYLIDHWLDITTTVLGFIYIVLEYRASILLSMKAVWSPRLAQDTHSSMEASRIGLGLAEVTVKISLPTFSG